VPATTVAGWAHADRANRGQSSALTCRVRHHSRCLSQRQPSEQKPEQRPHPSCPLPQWLVDPTPNELTEARAAPSPVVPANRVAGCAHADRRRRGQNSALTSRARHHSGLPSQRRPSEQRLEHRTHLTSPPPQWLAEPTPTKRTEARAAPSHVVHATTVAG
jgi:hypothetical protein